MRKNCTDLTNLGFDIKERRIKLGISQRNLANLIGVSLVTYQNWEQGITKEIQNASFDKLKNILSNDQQ